MKAGVTVALTTIVVFVRLLSSVIRLIEAIFRYEIVLAIVTITTDNNDVINEIYYQRSGGLTTVVDGFLYDYNGFNFCLKDGLRAPVSVLAATNNNDRKKKYDKGVTSAPRPEPRPTQTKAKRVNYYDCCDLICNIIAGLTAPATAIAAVTYNKESELGAQGHIAIDNCLERGEREREYNQRVSSTPRQISYPTPRPAKERDIKYYYCCDLICDLLIAGFDNNTIRCGFGTEVPIITPES